MPRTRVAIGLAVCSLLFGSATAEESRATPRWIPPADWLISCDGHWVYSPPDLEAPERAQNCSFIKLGRSGGVIWFFVTVLELTSDSTAYLSNGDGVLIEAGDWKLTRSGLVEIIVRPVDHEGVEGVTQESRTWTFSPNGRHLIDETHKVFFEPLALRYPTSQRRLRLSVREWVCGYKALQLTAGCASA